MKLLTKEIERKMPKPYSQENEKDPLVRVKYFCPWNHWTWYGIEYDPENRMFFGYVVGDYPELGYFSLDELESVRGTWGLGIERDIHFTPRPLSEVKKGLGY